ncbi:MAG: glycoside hydrolase family 15 protein [Candidatus Binataceae bacterium]
MALRIEDYAIIGNTGTAAMVGRDGSIPWLCMPRFDSPACFAELVGGPDNGHWTIAPANRQMSVRREYREGTLLLDTIFESESGAVTLTDFMPIADRQDRADVIRVVRGISGSVEMRMSARFRFDYGRVVPWVRRHGAVLTAIAGPDALALRTPVPLRNRNFATEAEFTVSAGDTVAFTLTWYPSHQAIPRLNNPLNLMSATETWWREWSARCAIQGPWRAPALRSLITLKALTYAPTGGIVAAPTAGLPESIGGARNWDYRYCWLRDATFTLYALLTSGYTEEARAWREWLLRAAAGRPEELQIMYGIAGERRLAEWEAPWLAGYENSRPVRIGNAAHEQFQLDVYGEVMDAFHFSRRKKLGEPHEAWRLEEKLMDFLESAWERPDDGIWEVRGVRRHFTHSKVMAWVAADRAVKAIESAGLSGPVERWRALRDRIHRDVCKHGFNPARNAFVQYYGADALDAAVLMIPLVGFLPAHDPRVAGTVEAIRRELMRDGMVMRYRPERTVDGLAGGEGVFLPCSFWFADNLALAGRQEEAGEMFDRLKALCNDVGLLSEEYDPGAGRMLGNFPQALTHVAMLNTIHNLMLAEGPAFHRASPQ